MQLKIFPSYPPFSCMKFACLSSETRTGMSSLALLAHGLPSFLESVQGEGSLTPRGLPTCGTRRFSDSSGPLPGIDTLRYYEYIISIYMYLCELCRTGIQNSWILFPHSLLSLPDFFNAILETSWQFNWQSAAQSLVAFFLRKVPCSFAPELCQWQTSAKFK